MNEFKSLINLSHINPNPSVPQVIVTLNLYFNIYLVG